MALSRPITKLEKQNQGLFNLQPIGQCPPSIKQRWSPLPFDFIARVKDNFVCIFNLADLPFISDLSFKNLVKAAKNHNDDKDEKRAARCALPLHVIEHEYVNFIIKLANKRFATISCKEVKIWEIELAKNIPIKINFIARFALFNIGNIRNVITNAGGTYLFGLHRTPNSEEFWALNLATGTLTTKHCPYPVNGSNQLVCLSDNSLVIVGERNSTKITEYFLHIQLQFNNNEISAIEIDARTFSNKKIKQLFITPDKQFWIILDSKNCLSLWLPAKVNEAAVKLFECQLNPQIKIEILPNGHVAILHNHGMLYVFNPYKSYENLVLLINNINDFFVMASGKLVAFKNDGNILRITLQSVSNYFNNKKDTSMKLLMDVIPIKVLVLLTLEYSEVNATTPPREALRIPKVLSEPLQSKMMQVFYHAQTSPETQAATRYLCSGLESKAATPAVWVENTFRLFATRRDALTAPLRELLKAVAELRS